MPFPITDTSPVSHQGTLPPKTDVVVLGGGVLGVMTAWFLADRGFSVVLCEKGRIAGEQSSRNWGWIRQQGRDFAELPVMMESLAIWQDLARTLGDCLGLRQEGTLYIARTEAEMAGFAAWRDKAQGFGLDCRILGRAELAALIPGHAAPWIGALYTPSDARAEPWTAVPLIAKALAAKGVTIRENCAVRALDLQAGRVAGVITEAGRIACAQVVVAGGAWSSLFLRAHGVVIPQLAVKASAARTITMPETFLGTLPTSILPFAADRMAATRSPEVGRMTLPSAPTLSGILAHSCRCCGRRSNPPVSALPRQRIIPTPGARSASGTQARFLRSSASAS